MLVSLWFKPQNSISKKMRADALTTKLNYSAAVLINLGPHAVPLEFQQKMTTKI